MSVDDVLFAIIIGGFALTGAYLRDQYALQCSRKAAALGAELRLRELCRGYMACWRIGPASAKSLPSH
jgi:hypothetical protein